ncbi:MAG: hypothetical protein J6R82_04350 [Clostridia bacterium]|nr:hypothetical protein [Clostridia bacterium]
MHTILINTSKNRFDESIDLLDIQQEIRQYIEITCPISTWNDPQKGYQGCVRKIGELIDSYKDISNDFNLILYVDLLELQAYVDAHKDTDCSLIQREAVIDMMYTTLVHYLTDTLGSELEAELRVPNELLIVLEHNELVSSRGDGVQFGEAQTKCVLPLFGLPTREELTRMVKEACEDASSADGEDGAGSATPVREEKIRDEAAFRDRFKQSKGKPWLDELDKHYQKEIDMLLESLIEGISVNRACEDFANKVVALRTRDEATVMVTHWVTDRRAIDWHKELRAKRNLQFQLFLLNCVTSKTTKEETEPGMVARPKSVREPGENWKLIIATLKAKQLIYDTKEAEAASLSDDCTKKQLVPELSKFDHVQFGLDEYGAKDMDYTIIDVEEDDENKKDSDTEDTAHKENDGKLLSQGKGKAMVASEKKLGSLFPEVQFKPFDYKDDGGKLGALGSKATVKQYEAHAQKLHTAHIKYLQKLKVHVSDVLAGYAGKSQRNKSALLQKRNVSIRGGVRGAVDQDAHYSKHGASKDNREPAAIQAVADAAYETARMEYLRFCAGNSVAVTDIEEQTNWFLTRIHQVAASLKKIRTVAFGLFWTVIALFVPYIVIQWEAISRNLFTALTAICSVAIPLALLLIVCGILGILQRKRFRELWDEYEKKSDEIQQENAKAAKRYDLLLSLFIPSLRWIYEFKSDAEFYAECCDMMKAKIAHHEQKLNIRKNAVEQLLEDLEYESVEQVESLDVSNDIDYNLPFCAHNANYQFYSIVEQNLLDQIY